MMPFFRHLYIYEDNAFIMIKYLDDFRKNYKIKSLNLYSECVTCYDIIRQGATEGKRDVKLVITAVHNIHFIVYWYIEVKTDLHKCDVIVLGITIVTWMYNCFCNTKNYSIGIWVIGAKPYRVEAGNTPVDSKIAK